MTTGFIEELADDDFDPGFYGIVKFGVGPNTPILRRRVLLVGLKAAASGSLTVDADVGHPVTPEEALALAGARSELYRMYLAAYTGYPDADIYLAAPTAPSGGVAATATITITGTWTTAGTWRYYVAGDVISGVVGATDTPTTLATAIVTAVTAKTKMAVSATSSAGVVTLRWGVVGARGNNGILFQDVSELPSGCSSAIAGGASVPGDSVTGAGVKFSGGTGTEDITALLETLASSERFHVIAAAQQDNTNLSLWENHIAAMAAYDIRKLEHLIVATNGTYASASTTATVQLNHQREAILWQLNGETPPPEVAAEVAAARAVLGQSMINRSYSGLVLKWAKPVRDRKSRPERAYRKLALRSGVTPIGSNDTEAFIVRAVTSRSLTSDGDPDYRTLDFASADVPDYVSDRVRLLWLDWKAVNKHVRADPAPEEPLPPPGVGTPRLWNGVVEQLLTQLERDKILTETALVANKPRSTFNRTAKRIATIIPVERLPLQEQMETVVEGHN